MDNVVPPSCGPEVGDRERIFGAEPARDDADGSTVSSCLSSYLKSKAVPVPPTNCCIFAETSTLTILGDVRSGARQLTVV